MNEKKKSWKLPLIIVGIVLAVIVCGFFMVYSIPNKAIALEEEITTARSEIEIQSKRRADLIPNLVDCVKAYDKHEYDTLMDVIGERDISDAMSTEIMVRLNAVSEQYPELKSQENYKELMNELSTTENKIAQTRSSYNTWVTRYNTYCKRFPNPFFLNMTGYEKQNFPKLSYNVSEDAPIKLFD